jgi:hypothetical protein
MRFGEKKAWSLWINNPRYCRRGNWIYHITLVHAGRWRKIRTKYGSLSSYVLQSALCSLISSGILPFHTPSRSRLVASREAIATAHPTPPLQAR